MTPQEELELRRTYAGMAMSGFLAGSNMFFEPGRQAICRASFDMANDMIEYEKQQAEMGDKRFRVTQNTEGAGE